MVNFFTSLDSIMDTRLSTLYALDQNLAVEQLTSGSYVNRKKDNFKNISSDIFNTMYKNRTKFMLAITTVTESINLLGQFILESISELKNVESGVLSSDVYINIYPYKLNNIEQEQLFNLFSKLLPEFVYVKFVDMSLDELTPDWVSKNVNNILLYDGLQWLEIQSSNSNIIRKPLIDTILYVPTIANGNISSDKLDNNFFNNMTNSLGGLITIIPIDTKYFCSKLSKK